jgi:hypothetical protein
MAEGLKAMPDTSQRWRLAGMIAATVVWAVMAAFGALACIFSPLIFDRPGNIMNPLAWLSLLLLVTFWIVCILAPFGAWVVFRRGQESLAWAAMAAPLAWLALLAAVLQFVPG